MIVTWPTTTLRPAQILANPVPFTRSGGRSLGGIERVTRTDRGYWSIVYKSVLLSNPSERQYFNAIRTTLNGMAGSLTVPVWSHDSNGAESSIVVTMAAAASVGDTQVTLELGSGIDNLAGVRFSYNHALYETGFAIDIYDDQWIVPIFPALRADIAADAVLEFDSPTCLVKLASDREMDVSLTAGMVDRADVSFIEDVEYWNDLAIPGS
jgi:hypothetical protein